MFTQLWFFRITVLIIQIRSLFCVYSLFKSVLNININLTRLNQKKIAKIFCFSSYISIEINTRSHTFKLAGKNGAAVCLILQSHMVTMLGFYDLGHMDFLQKVAYFHWKLWVDLYVKSTCIHREVQYYWYFYLIIKILTIKGWSRNLKWRKE